MDNSDVTDLKDSWWSAGKVKVSHIHRQGKSKTKNPKSALGLGPEGQENMQQSSSVGAVCRSAMSTEEEMNQSMREEGRERRQNNGKIREGQEEGMGREERMSTKEERVLSL